MTIGDRIRQRRQELNMSQDELAHKLGYTSRSTINKIEKNANNLKQTKIEEIAKALETTPDYIMGWQSKKDFNLDENFIIESYRTADNQTKEMVKRLLIYANGIKHNSEGDNHEGD